MSVSMNILNNPVKIVVTDQYSHEYNAAESDVKIDYNDGCLKITAGCTEIKNIKLYFNRPRRKNSMVYTDAWERAYGNLVWSSKDVKGAWYMIEYAEESAFCVGVKVQPNSFCGWEYCRDTIIFTADIKNGSKGVLLHGRTLFVAELVEAEVSGTMNECAALFCTMLCANPKKLVKPIYGGNDWYCNYGNNSYEKIIRHAQRIAECAPAGDNRPYMVVDDGWELCHCDDGVSEHFYNGGPWAYSNRNFNDMQRLANDLRKIGVIPGIWYRPLMTLEKLPAEYILRREGLVNILDISQECVLDLVRDDISRFAAWGYGLIKHDFSSWDIFGKWGFEMQDEVIPNYAVFHDKSRTNAEIIKSFYKTIKEVANDILIMGCNTFSHLSAGIFDLQRTGDDTSGREWESTRKMGINTLAMRMHQHNIFYGVDADCVGITNAVPWEKNKQWLDVLSKSGTPLFVSIADDAYSFEVKNAIKTAFELAAQNQVTSRAVIEKDKLTPCIWKSVAGTDIYKW